MVPGVAISVNRQAVASAIEAPAEGSCALGLNSLTVSPDLPSLGPEWRVLGSMVGPLFASLHATPERPGHFYHHWECFRFPRPLHFSRLPATCGVYTSAPCLLPSMWIILLLGKVILRWSPLPQSLSYPKEKSCWARLYV